MRKILILPKMGEIDGIDQWIKVTILDFYVKLMLSSKWKWSNVRTAIPMLIHTRLVFNPTSTFQNGCP